MKKELRQAKIEQLITKQIISNQDDLLKALKKSLKANMTIFLKMRSVNAVRLKTL